MPDYLKFRKMSYNGNHICSSMKGHHFTNFENERKKIIGNHPKVPILGPEQACGQSIDSEDLEMK